MYRVFRTQEGTVDAVNRMSDGASLPYSYQSKSFNESHPLVIELRQWEQQTGTSLDVSDHPPAILPPPEPNWSEFLNSIRYAGLATRFYASAKDSLVVNTAFTLLIDCLTGLYDIDGFQTAFIDLQNYVQPPFSEGEVNYMNQALSDNDFPFQLTFNNE